jgi:hypothetical protein
VYTPPALASFVFDRLLEGGALPQGRWLDPACGEGVFMVEAVRRLATVIPADELSAAVEASLVCVDIDATACERTRLAVRAEVGRHAGPQRESFFAENVLAGDFLRLGSDDLGTFAAIVGNPPYVSATHLSSERKRELLARFETAWGRLDLYGLFFEHAAGLVAPDGRLAFITPDKFLTAESARPLRAYLAARCPPRLVARFDRHDLFPGVATVPAVTVLESPASASRELETASCAWWDLGAGGAATRRGDPVALTVTRAGRPWEPAPAPAPARGRRPTVPLGALVTRVSAGVATGLNSCFVLPDVQAEALELEPALLRPAVRGQDIGPGEIRNPRLCLLLPYAFDEGGPPRLIDLALYSHVAAHLAASRAELEQRHCVRVWRKRWYDLHDPVMCDLAPRAKLLVPDLAKESRFAFDPGTVVPLHSAYYLEPAPATGFEPEALAAVLNTPELESEVLRRAPLAKSGYRRFRAQFLRELPIPKLSPAEQEALLKPDADPAAREPVAWLLAHDAA